MIYYQVSHGVVQPIGPVGFAEETDLKPALRIGEK